MATRRPLVVLDSGQVGELPVGDDVGGASGALGSLSDVVLTTPADGYVLTYQSSSGTWIDAAPTGGSGTTDHAALSSNLAWTTSGHTGTASRLAGWDSGGTATTYVIGTGSGQIAAGDHTHSTYTLSAVVPSTAPAAGQVLAGNSGGTAYAPVTVSGSGATISLASTGVMTISGIANTSLANSSVTVTAGTGLSGGGAVALGGSVSLAVSYGTTSGTACQGNDSRLSDSRAASSVSTSTTTAISGLLKGATTLAAASAGTDYVAPGGALGTPASGTLTSCTGLPLAGLTSAVQPANVLINGGFRFWQRVNPAGVTIADSTYQADRWVSLTDTAAAATISRSAGTDTASPSVYACKVVAGGTSKRFGQCQWVEAANSVPLRGRTVRFQLRVRPFLNAGSGTWKVRCAILEWTGTADTLSTARDPVNDWTSGTFATGGFFKGTTQNLVGTAGVTASHNTWTDLAVTGTVGATANNLCVMWWVEDAPAHANDYVEVSAAGLYDGADARPWLPRPVGEELALCQRYYEKSFPVDTAPADNAGYLDYFGGAWAAANVRCSVFFRVTKFASPTIAYYNSGNTGAGLWQFYHPSSGWLTATSMSSGSVGINSFTPDITRAASATAGNAYMIQGHWAAEAEL